MKHYTREHLQKIAADVFGRYPKAQTVACTEDGVPFITDDTERYVKEHARSGKYAGGLKIERFRRCDMPAQENGTTSVKKATGSKSAKAKGSKAGKEKAAKGEKTPAETQPQPSPVTEADEIGKIDNQQNK